MIKCRFRLIASKVYYFVYFKTVRLYVRLLHLYNLVTRKIIIIDGFIYEDKNRIIKRHNLGDDINIPLLEKLTGRKVRLFNTYPIKNVSRLMAIGSIVEYYSSQHSIIWGSGAIRGDVGIKEKPLKVLAVRGKLTKEYLEGQGVPCPEVYGDPALLMPLIFKPTVLKKYKIGFIPHYVDYDLPHVIEFRNTHPNILFIRFANYSSWEDVIRQICSCERIVSSSLHGLILADAYHIPNVWVRFSDKITGGEFKYKDYFSGVGRNYVSPVDCTRTIELSKIMDNYNNFIPINPDLTSLLKVFPYKVNKKYRLK